MPPSIPTQADSIAHFTVNGTPVSAERGTTVAAALMQAGIASHKSVSGQHRSALCAMGICMECCATVNGVQHVRTCQVLVEPGMEIVTR